jgi:hypothetical protein
MTSMGTYSFVQQQTLDYVNRFKNHPYASRVLFTAHAGIGKLSTDTGSIARCLGPIVFGTSMVNKAPGWFSSYFHVEPIPANAMGQGSPEMRKVWFRFHADNSSQSGLMWPSKLGGPARLSEEFNRIYPGGFVPSWLQNGLQGGLRPILQAFDLASGPIGGK